MSGKLNKPIMLRLSEEVVESVELAAKAEGLIIQDWIRLAIEEKLHSSNICPDCGTYNSLDSKFCKKCGKKLVNIQKRLLTNRNDRLLSFGSQYNTLINELNELKNTTSVGKNYQDCVNNQIIKIQSLIKSWDESIIIIQQLKENILQYDLDPEINKQLEVQDKFIDEFNDTVSNFENEIAQCRMSFAERLKSKLETNSKEGEKP